MTRDSESRFFFFIPFNRASVETLGNREDSTPPYSPEYFLTNSSSSLDMKDLTWPNRIKIKRRSAAAQLICALR